MSDIGVIETRDGVKGIWRKWGNGKRWVPCSSQWGKAQLGCKDVVVEEKIGVEKDIGVIETRDGVKGIWRKWGNGKRWVPCSSEWGKKQLECKDVGGVEIFKISLPKNPPHRELWLSKDFCIRDKEIMWELLESNSASPTDIFQSEDGLFKKRWTIKKNKQTLMSIHKEGLEYEKKIYKVVNDILNQGYSPCFVSPVGMGVCGNYSSIITRHSDGPTLKKWLKKTNNLTHKNVMELLFMIMWTLRVLEMHSITHHDLHPGNMFVQNIKKARHPLATGPMVFAVDENRFYKFEPLFIPLFYDWDRSYHEGSGPNPQNTGPENCNYDRQCNEVFSKRDIYYILCSLDKYAPSLEHITSDFYDPEIKNINIAGFEPVQPEWNPCSLKKSVKWLADKKIKNASSILNNKVFDEFLLPAGAAHQLPPNQWNLYTLPGVDRERVIKKLNA